SPCSPLFPSTTLFRSVFLTCCGSALAQAPSATLAGTRPTSPAPETPNLPDTPTTSPSSPSAASSPVPEVAPPRLTDILFKNFKRSEEHTSELQSRGHL